MTQQNTGANFVIRDAGGESLHVLKSSSGGGGGVFRFDFCSR